MRRHQSQVNHHRGLFVAFDCLTSAEISFLRSVAEKDAYIPRELYHNNKDIGFDSHPAFQQLSPVSDDGYNVKQILISIITKNGWADIFKVKVDKEPVDMFVMKYTGGGRKAERTKSMTFHYDVCSSINNYASVVFSLQSEDCKGGAIELSNRNDGEWTGQSADVFTLRTTNNHAYIFNGNYVAHSVNGISDGERYAFVGFFETEQTHIDVMALWNSYPPFLCPRCSTIFSQRKSLLLHRRQIHCKNIWALKFD